jgi:CBS domain containing-hemolysin-like protein
MIFSRIPIFETNSDNITGLVTNRELLISEREGRHDMTLDEIARPVHKVSKNVPVHHLLDLFIKKQEHLFLVEDQFNQLVGIVTLEDAIETMLGREIVDETDTVEDMQHLAKKLRDRK